MAKFRQVPWASAQEWSDTYSKLYSESKDIREQGVKRVKSWVSRGRIPISAESTMILVDCELSCNRLQLSMAIVRFVNGLVDNGQKGLYAGSALSVAAEIGLAPWIVELRHQATHDKLPSLVLLHSARAQGLDWLRQNYWEIQAHSTTLLQTSLQECISSYISAQIDGNPDNIVLEYLSTLKSALNVDMVHFLIPILLRTGFFNFDLVEECLTLPQETKSYWEPLLTCCICTYPTFTSLLLESLIEMLGQSTCTLEKTKKIEIWIMFLIERYLDPWKNYSVSRAIYQLLQVRCKTTLRISKWIAGKYDVPEITKSIFLYLEDKPYTNPVIDFDLDERYQHVSKRAKCNYDNENVSDAGIWKRAVGWYPSHLGTLNGSVADLKLDDEYDNHELMSSAGRIWNASKV